MQDKPHDRRPRADAEGWFDSGGSESWVWGEEGVSLPRLREVTAPTDSHNMAPGPEEEAPRPPPSGQEQNSARPPAMAPRIVPGGQALDPYGVPRTVGAAAPPPAPPAAASGPPPARAAPVWRSAPALPRYGAAHPPEVLGVEHQLHWATVPLRTGLIALVFLALVAVALLQIGPQRVLGVTLIVFALAGTYTMADWWVTRFRVEGDHLTVRQGLIFRTVSEVPLSRLQAVDTVRPMLMQILGLSELRIELAGGDRGEVRLRYIDKRIAERLRAALLAYSAGLPGSAPPAPEHPFYRVPFLLLLAALVLRLPVLAAFGALLTLMAVGIVFDELGVLGGVVPLLLGLIRGFLGPLIRYSAFAASLSPDGLRLRHGIAQRRMQTVPPGRVQAVQVVEPVLWRVLGLARVEANVAGYVGERQMDSSVLLPLADRATAFELVDVLCPGAAASRVPLVRAAGRRSAAAGLDDTLFVTRRGYFARVTEIVPLARIQSVRLSAGPFARWTGVAIVEADSSPGPVRARAAGRALGDARRMLEEVTVRARRARATAEGPERWGTREDPPGAL